MRRKVPLVVAVVLMIAAVAVWQLRRGAHPEARSPASQEIASASTTRATDPRTPAVPASLSGHVTRKPDHGPIANAQVAITRADLGAMFSPGESPTIVVATDASGAWTAPKVPPGTYVVAATANGFVPATRDRLVIAAGEQKTGIDLALDAGGTLVHGTVTDVGGGPIAEVRVTVRHHRNFNLSSGAELVAVTGADGTYQLTLPDDSFTAAASHDDYTKVSHDFDVAGKPVVVDFVLIPGGVIHGQVVARDTGKPVPGALVDASRAHRSGGPGNTIADADGNFTVRGLRSGAIRISAAARGYASSAPTVVELGIGEQVDGVKVVLDHAFSISGKVVKKHEPATGIAGVRLGVFSMAAGQTAMAPDPTDAAGRFEIIGVRPASYIVFAIGEGAVPEIGKSVEVVDHDIKDVTIEMGLGATLSGRVEPVASASIGVRLDAELGIGNMLEMGKTMIVHADTDETGAFVLHNVPAGKLVVTAKTKEGSAGELPVTVGEVDQVGLVVALEARASISGKVIDTRGAPVSGASVDVMPTERRAMMSFDNQHSAISAGDGSFRVVGLDAGKYRVDVSSGPELRLARLLDKTRKPVEVELAKGAERTGLTLTIDAQDGAIHGAVVGSDGKPAADAWVTARAELPKDSKMPGGDSFEFLDASPPVLTGIDGTFAITKLRPGTYTLVADGARGGSRVEKTGVKTGESVTLTLAPLGTLSGHVTTNRAPVGVYDLSCRGPAGTITRRITAADGGYELDHLAPGSYACDVSADGGTAKGTVDVPGGAAQLDLALVAWASVTGIVVSVLSGQPIAGLTVVAGSLDSRSFGDALMGQAPTTDASGRFVLEHVATGSGKVMFVPKNAGFDPLATRDYTVTDGQRLDLGTIKIIPPRTGDAGTLGMATEVKDGKLVVTLVSPGGPAEQAGVQVGDTIVSIDGHQIADLAVDIAQQLLASGKIGAGQAIVLGLGRGVSATLTAAKSKW